MPAVPGRGTPLTRLQDLRVPARGSTTWKECPSDLPTTIEPGAQEQAAVLSSEEDVRFQNAGDVLKGTTLKGVFKTNHSLLLVWDVGLEGG